MQLDGNALNGSTQGNDRPAKWSKALIANGRGDGALARRARQMACALTLICIGMGAAIAGGTGFGLPVKVTDVDDAKIIAGAATGKDWLTNGLDYASTRFSQLKKIDTTNVKKLGLAWSYDLASTRGVQATPIVVGGVMYVTAPWSVVHAVDVRTGKKLWTYDPKVPRDGAFKGCCDVVNRGAAVYKGKVYVASFDARLIAIDAASGKKVWETDTSIDRTRAYTLTDFPIIYKDKVIIGTAGGEYGIRGSVSAYDAATGALKWRWFTVPGDPSKPFEDESQENAAATWSPSTKYWINGGGGAAWHGMSIDPKLDMLYFGTGQGGPWSAIVRDPNGGENLYLNSIVALNADTGKYVWHYQQVPRDRWDYDSCMDLILADIKIQGQEQKVIMQAHKNGFYFVLDRRNGKFISASNFVDVNWAKGYDINGRAIELAGARDPGPRDIVPGNMGGHNWHSMSYSPLTGLAYIPAHYIPTVLGEDPTWTGHDQPKVGQAASGLGVNLAMQFGGLQPKAKPFGRLIAWDPVKQKQVWSKSYGDVPWNGGTLVTASNLVFQGTADGRLLAFNATTGEELWQAPVGGGVVAAPITYEVDFKQYVSIAVGWGGFYGQMTRHSDYSSAGRVFTFVLDGKAAMPALQKVELSPLLSGIKYDPKDIPAGEALYVSHCAGCHGVPAVDKGGNIANLAYVDKSFIENLDVHVGNGPFLSDGMPDLSARLSKDDVEKLKAFIQGVADSIRKP